MATVVTHSNRTGLSSPTEERSVKEILSDLYRNSKGVAEEEIGVIKQETKEVGKKTALHGGLVAGFGALAVLSIFPFLAALIIGLGRLMDDNYWASSLIVGVLCLAIGGGVAYASLQKLKEDFHFPKSKATLKRLFAFLEIEKNKLKNDEVFSHGTTHGTHYERR